MIKCEVIKEFTLERFDKLKNIVRRNIDIYGRLFVGDVFECEQDMCDYLMGKNKLGKTVVKVIEVEPEKEKYSFVIAEKLDDEHITPLGDKETLEKLGDAIVKNIEVKPKSTKKKKTSKK